jgi:hypothetical protein
MFRQVGNQRGAVVGVALARFRQKYQRWPERLDQLVGEFLDKVPRDPLTGDPLQYRRIGSGEDSGRGQSPVVYSVGVDRDDDRGEPTRINADGSLPPPDSPAGDRPVAAGDYRLTLPRYLDGDWIVWPRGNLGKVK